MAESSDKIEKKIGYKYKMIKKKYSVRYASVVSMFYFHFKENL